MKKPMIGVTALYDIQRESIWMIPGYLEGLKKQGAIPFILPLHMSEEEFKQIDQNTDGYLFTGGQDVEPSLYGETKAAYCGETYEDRDCLERMIYQTALRENKPVLAICRGIQLINTLHGGTLYQDLDRQFGGTVKLEHHMEAPYNRTVHGVRIMKHSPLHRVLKKEKLQVNSYHHQGIKELGKGLEVMAAADDGLIEGVYVPDKKFVWAVQWHPEFIYQEDKDQSEIFRAFVEAGRL